MCKTAVQEELRQREGGKGGNASLIVLGAPSPVFDIGGNGGNADAVGAIGWKRRQLRLPKEGRQRRQGCGDAHEKEGKGGAEIQRVLMVWRFRRGGNGGNGGDGCPEGKAVREARAIRLGGDERGWKESVQGRERNIC